MSVYPIYTTGQIARICSVAPLTVVKWIDKGHLKGYRLPGGTDRRVTCEEFKKFLIAQDMPIFGALDPRKKKRPTA